IVWIVNEKARALRYFSDQGFMYLHWYRRTTETPSEPSDRPYECFTRVVSTVHYDGPGFSLVIYTAFHTVKFQGEAMLTLIGLAGDIKSQAALVRIDRV